MFAFFLGREFIITIRFSRGFMRIAMHNVIQSDPEGSGKWVSEME